jgi:hypothetical protein
MPICFSLQGAILRNPVGDFKGAEVVAVDTPIASGAVTITIH